MSFKLKEVLGEFSFAKRVGQIFGENIKTVYHDHMIDHFQKREVYIYNCTGPDNKETVDEFVKIAETLYKFKVKRTNGPGLTGYNIPIIFDSSYYKENKLPDPHNQPTMGITQFAIIDTIRDIVDDYNTRNKKYETKLKNYADKKKKWESEKENLGKKYPNEPPASISIPEIEAMFEQLFIKEYVDGGNINFYHWADEHYPGNWTFARPISHTEKRKTILEGFAYITINPENKIIEKEFYNPLDPFAPSKLSHLDWEHIDYAVINPKGHINTVTGTGASTLPDGLSIKRIIDENNKKLDEYNELTKDWSEEQKEADKKNKPQRAEKVATKKTQMKYMGGCIGVGYYKISESRWIYYVGAQDNPNQAIVNASRVYLIESVDNSEIFFEELFPMMAVPFVRHEQNTVIPFPIKYVNEWYKKDNPTWKP